MRIPIIIFFAGVFLFGISGQIAISQSSNLSIPHTSIQEDPNINPNWNWRIGDDPSRIYPDAAYTMYHKSDNTTVYEHFVDAPWSDPANSNAGLGDNKKEDGWELLARDFGTPTRGITGVSAGAKVPYFLLFNKYRSIARLFVLAQNGDTFDKGFVEIKFQNIADATKTPAVLAHFKPVADAIDKLTNMKNNVNSVFSNVLKMNVWLWADFPLSYDPTITPKAGEDPPRFFVTVWGQKLSNIGLKGISQGTSGNAKFVNDWLTGSGLDFGNGSVGVPNLKMPNLDFENTGIDLGNYQFKPSATHVNWNSFKNYLGKISIKTPSVDIGNPFKGLFDGFNIKLSSLANALPISLPGLDIGGLFDFFVNGGAKKQEPAEPAPTYIAMNLELSGTITSTQPIHFFQITIPGTRDEYWKPTWGSSVGIVRNDPVGILTLNKTPVIYEKYFFKYYDPFYNEYGLLDYGELAAFTEYEIAEDIQLSLNQSSGLEIIKTEVSLILDYRQLESPPYTSLNDFLSWVGSGLQNHLVDFEAPANSTTAKFKTMAVPIKYAKGRTIQIPPGYTDNICLKVKSVLKRKDDPSAQPVVFIATYKVEVVNKIGPAEQILSTIPPQNIKCAVPTSGGVRVSWDRNLEKNINLYAVERSINGASFVQIGTTSDTVFTDVEVQKAVKPYRSNRQNVSVNYRVRANSYWYDPENAIYRSQFSAYGDIINISGSIIGLFDKWGFDQIIPESNSLSQNFPNPFNPSTTIYYGIKDPGNVTIKIYNTLGQEIITLVDERKEVGSYYVDWNAVGLPSGIYFYKIQSGNFAESKKMILTK